MPSPLKIHGRVVAAAIACLCWLGFMIWQAVTSANPVVVSRPQVFSAKAVVEGFVVLRENHRSLRVEEILWPKDKTALGDLPGLGAGLSIELPETSKRVSALPIGATVIVPLDHRPRVGYSVQTLLPDPTAPETLDMQPIYPATASVRKQVDEILKRREQQPTPETKP